MLLYLTYYMLHMLQDRWLEKNQMCIVKCSMTWYKIQKLYPLLVFQGHVVMGTQAISPYQQVIEKTKALAFRAQMMAVNIKKKEQKQQEVSTKFISGWGFWWKQMQVEKFFYFQIYAQFIYVS